MQQLTCKMVWSFSFYSLVNKGLNFKKHFGATILKKCEKVPKRFCPLVVALSFSLNFVDTFNSVQTRCIVKGEAQKRPLFWQFCGGF